MILWTLMLSFTPIGPHEILDVDSLDKEAFICYLLMSAKDISCSFGF